jgi:putative flippase GtrA
VVDLALFGLFSTYLFPSLTAKIGLATLLARCISGAVNFMMNKHWIFQNERSLGCQGIKYGALFITQLSLSWVLVELLSGLPIPLVLVKALVDGMLFFASYAIQKK